MARRYPNRQYTDLGKLIARLTHSLATVKDWPMEEAMSYMSKQTHRSHDMVYRWQQGRSLPRPEILEILAQIGKDEVELSREWGENLLVVGQHPNATTVVNNLWGPKEVHPIPCNLPRLEHTTLIGRQTEIDQLLQLLTPQYAAHLITVDGIGGVGKTALVLEVAHRCWKASTGEVPNPKVSTFEAIIFVSAKQNYLTPQGILPSTQAQRTLRDIFREIALTLNRLEIRHAIPQDQLNRVRDALGRQRTLLIVDNLETVEDKQETLSFLYGLPPSVKVVITTRERAMFSPIRLEQLAEAAALNLIEEETHKQNVTVSKEDAQALYQHIGGIPAALAYAIGQIASGYSLTTVLARVPQTGSDVARFCFEGSVEPLRGQNAHLLLMVLAMFPKSPSRLAVAYTVGLTADPIVVEDSLAQLQRLSLVNQQEARYKMLSLTREYALAELAAYPEFEREARVRWLEWYLEFTKEYGGHDGEEWHIRFNRIEEEWENLLAVFDWCASHDKYEAIQAFWQEEGAGSVLDFSDNYGYWDDRLTWLTWLIEAAESRGDWSTAVEAMKNVGFILTLMGRLADADEFFERGWKLYRHAVPEVQISLAVDAAFLRIYQQRFADAQHLLDQAWSLVDTTELDEVGRIRWRINIEYDYGVMYYWQQDYDQAGIHFQRVMEHTKGMHWQRTAIYAQNYLANIAIAQNKLSEAQQLLETGLTIAERNKEKRYTAFYKRSLARLHQKLGDLSAARYWAQEARDGFDRLGMQLEWKEMDQLLQELQMNFP